MYNNQKRRIYPGELGNVPMKIKYIMVYSEFMKSNRLFSTLCRNPLIVEWGIRLHPELNYHS